MQSPQPDRVLGSRRWRRIALLAFLVVDLVVLLAIAVWWFRPPTRDHAVTQQEHAVQTIVLPSPFDAATVEYSAATMAHGHLVLVPQFPARVDSSLLVWRNLEGTNPEEPALERVPLLDPQGVAAVPGFEGFEGVVWVEPHLYLVIESRTGLSTMHGTLVRASVQGDWESLTLDPTFQVSLPDQAGVENKSYEALTVCDGQVVALYELTGPGFNDAPRAAFVDPSTGAVRMLPAPAVAYRVTDATTPDASGEFWATNYAWPGDREIAAGDDPLGARWGVGPRHAASVAVERLVAMRCTADGITLVDRAPVYLDVDDSGPRNWEALARTPHGLFLATDRFPATVAGWLSPAP